MVNIEQAIAEINKQMKQIGIDYSKGEDMTAITLIGDTAETVIKSLQEKLARENPQPLTLDELKDRNGKPVWIYSLTIEKGYWGIVSTYDFNGSLMLCGSEFMEKLSDYNKTWAAYDNKPIKKIGESDRFMGGSVD